MITVAEAFKKFRSRLELTDREQDDASRRHTEIRDYLKGKFDIDRDFLTGSYKRWTKTKPLKDVDIFCVPGKKERHRRDKPPADLLKAFEDALVEKYGRSNVSRQRRSVTVDFGVKPDADEDTGRQGHELRRGACLRQKQALRNPGHFHVLGLDGDESRSTLQPCGGGTE